MICGQLQLKFIHPFLFLKILFEDLRF